MVINHNSFIYRGRNYFMNEEKTNSLDTATPDGADEQKTYTEAEVMDMVQREADRRVSQAMKKAQAKFDAKLSEAEKLRTMDEAQRKEYEFQQKLSEFEAQKKEFAITQNKLSASKVMAERGLPVQFVDYIVAEDADTMMESINAFEKQWKAAVSDAVSAAIAKGAKPTHSSATQTGMTKEQFQKLSLSQQAELFSTNPQLYKELTQR